MATAHEYARSDLAVLVDTEARLDRELAEAREAASAVCEAAKRRADEIAAAREGELHTARAQLANDIAVTTSERIAELERTAREEIARYEAVRGERLRRVARRVAERLVALVLEEAT